MEIQLQELIDQIKKEGVQAAESEAEEILSSAKAQAEKLKEKERIAKERAAQAEKEKAARYADENRFFI